MLSLHLIFAAMVAFGCSGLPACFLPARSRLGQATAAALMTIGGALGLGALILSATGGGGAGVHL